ncbi:MAG TPA: prolyl oligopeptidase family serine peptidase [Chitinophagales bacterium]|nr:prolyl oligopeptidase family serine peptidase [Chitinophagales bacterium]
MRKILYLILTMSVLASCARVNYFKTKKIDHTDNYFGHEVKDEYQWLEDDQSKETEVWVNKENKITQKYLSKIQFKDQMNTRLTELNDYERMYDFRKAGLNYIYQKNTGLQKQSVFMIRPAYEQEGIEDEVLIDPNLIDSTGKTQIKLLEYFKNFDYIVAAFNQSGSDWSTLKVYDIANRKFLSDELKWVKWTTIQWYNQGFYYSRYDAPPEGKELSSVNDQQKIYFHKIGEPQEEDILIFEDPNASKLYYELLVTDDEKYQILNKYNGTDGYETHYRRLTNTKPKKGQEFKVLYEGYDSKNKVIGSTGEHFYVLSNYEAPNNKLVAVDINRSIPEAWVEIISEKDALLEDVKMVSGKFLALYLKNAQSELVEMKWNGTARENILLPGLGTVKIEYADPGDSEFLYSYSSFTQPYICYSGDVNSRDFKILAEPTINFDASLYDTDQVWYTSKDGTKISMFILKKKGLVMDGTNPAYLYGYGGFSVNLTPRFSSSYIALLEQGVVIAIPNLRGGAEFGEDWHRAGMKMNKQNVFDDFIAAAEYLIKEKYTSSEKLAIAGGSNGGLLVGAVMTQRPELAQVAFPAVGVMDMLKFQKFTVGWGWVPEYGSSEESEEMFKYLLGYSPYHNLEKKVKYPATLITTADHDDRVVPAHSYKFAARLQEKGKKKNPLLIQIFKDSGHGAGKPINKRIEETAEAWSFFLKNVGVKTLVLPKNEQE